MLDGVEYGVFGNLVKHYAARVFGLESQHFIEVPCYGLTLAVLIGREPYGLRTLCSLFQIGYQGLLVGRDFIHRLEVRVDAYADVFFAQVTDVSEARHHFIVLS